MIDCFPGGLVKHTFTNINYFLFFSNVCMRAFSSLHFLAKPVSDFVRFSFFVDIGGITLYQKNFY